MLLFIVLFVLVDFNNRQIEEKFIINLVIGNLLKRQGLGGQDTPICGKRSSFLGQ